MSIKLGIVGFIGELVHICGHYSTELRDIPLYPGTRQSAVVSFHRYRCQNCGKSFYEDIYMKHPGTRITERAANWIRILLLHHLSISAVQQITGIHWDTIVKAVAMDMNASYNRLVELYLPQAEIVYDRYHMQAQYGKDVLGAVRLAEAKTHKAKADEMQASADKSKDPAERKTLREEA